MKHVTGSREEWLAARKELLVAEKELTHKSDEIAALRQKLPWVRVEKITASRPTAAPRASATSFVVARSSSFTTSCSAPSTRPAVRRAR